MKKNFSKITLLLFISFAVFVALGVSLYLFYSNIQDTKISLGALSGDLKSEKEKNSELDSINRNLKSTLADHDRLESFFVNDSSVVDFLQNVEGLGNESGLVIHTDSVSSSDSPDLLPLNKELLSVSLSARGSWADTQKFLGLIENLPYKISISSFSSVSSNGPVSDSSLSKSELQKLAKHFWASSIVFSVIKNKP